MLGMTNKFPKRTGAVTSSASAWHGVNPRGVLVGFVGVGEDAPRAFEVSRPGVGDAYEASRPTEQSDAQALFQRRDSPSHCRRGEAEAARAARETLLLGYGDKHGHEMEAVHCDNSY